MGQENAGIATRELTTFMSVEISSVKVTFSNKWR